jgi:hypothetical protein
MSFPEIGESQERCGEQDQQWQFAARHHRETLKRKNSRFCGL